MIKEGGISDVLQALNNIQDMVKQQADCCAQILKRLDKLDDILAAIKRSARRQRPAEERNWPTCAISRISSKDQVNGLPKPLDRGTDTEHRAYRGRWAR